MAVYKLFPKGDINSVAEQQRKRIKAQLQLSKFSKDTSNLERELNDFFYSKKGDNFEQYYTRASDIASQAFNERYQSYNFELNMDKMSAKFTNSNIKFLNKEATLQQAIDLADTIELYMKNNNIEKEKWFTIISKIQNLQSLSNWSDVKDINGIVASILFGNKIAYGDAFEYPLAAFSALLTEGVDATTNDLLKNLQVDSSTKSFLDISHVSKKDKQKMNIKNTMMINDGTKLEYSNPTLNKVDVNLTLDGEKYNISAKSYSTIYKDIHILGGSPLSAPVLNLSSVDFVSHYLTQLYLENGDLDRIHEAVRLNILFMALTGSGNSPTEADTFVINDKSHRKIYVRSMGQIVNQILNNSSKSKYLNINNNGNNIPDDPLRNYSQKKKKDNIVNMISDMHKIKLQVSIKGTAIKNAI